MKIIAGVDEVGRGSLIGPVYAAAVILNKKVDIKLLKDSKTISKEERKLLSNYIKKNSVWVIGKASVKEIDNINILQASLLAMKRAIKKLKKKPTHVLIDGNQVPELKNYNHGGIFLTEYMFLLWDFCPIASQGPLDSPCCYLQLVDNMN